MKNLKTKVMGAVIASTALLSTNAMAGALLEAAKTEIEPIKADVVSGGAITNQKSVKSVASGEKTGTVYWRWCGDW